MVLRLNAEQKKYNGSVPDVVPSTNYPGDGSTAWGEAATIIPWNVYLHYGDKEILVRQYDSMKAWVDYMRGGRIKSMAINICGRAVFIMVTGWHWTEM